jgi:hypothetical protein
MAAVYFADTFWWIAVANPKDAWHARVLAWEAAHSNAWFVTTEEILSELLTWFAGTGPAGRAHAGAVVRGILAAPLASQPAVPSGCMARAGRSRKLPAWKWLAINSSTRHCSAGWSIPESPSRLA